MAQLGTILADAQIDYDNAAGLKVGRSCHPA